MKKCIKLCISFMSSILFVTSTNTFAAFDDIKTKTAESHTKVSFDNIETEKAVRALINKPAGSIYKNELDKITELNPVAYTHAVTTYDINYLKYFPNLETLQLSDMELNNIDVIRILKKLRSIEFLNVNIKDVNSLSNVSEIKFSCCGIQNVYSIRNLANIKKLELGRYMKYGNNKNKVYGSCRNINLYSLIPKGILDKLKNLQELSISEQVIEDGNDLLKLSRLKSLSLYCIDIKNNKNAIEELKRRCVKVVNE